MLVAEAERDKCLDNFGRKKIVLMTGFQSYPTPLNQLRLNRIQKLRDVFLSDKSKIRVGYADHSLPDSRECVGLCAMACALGATVIEKHITLGEVMKLEDYESAVNPDKFADLINSVQGLLPALEHKSSVDGYSMGSSERAYRTKMRRNVVSRKSLRRTCHL